MKKYIFKALYMFLALSLFASCEKDAEITKLSVITFPKTFSVSANSATLTKANDSIAVLTFNWPSVSYGIKAPVTYSLQFDVPSDTTGTTAWSKAKEVVVGDNVLSKSMLGIDLNTIAIDALGLTPGIVSKVVVRAKSYVDRPAYSNAVSLDINPYIVYVGYLALWVEGDFQGWVPATAPRIVSVNSDNFYEGYIYVPAGGTNHFKFLSSPDLTHLVYGDGGNGTLSSASAAADLILPSDGYYELSVNTNTLIWTATKTTWSILGDASPGGWTTDTQMSYDAVNKVWKVTCAMVSNGSFKFRANNAWKIDFGIDANGNLAYADNPLYPYNGSLSNLTVPSSGTYTITLDLHVPGQYSYKLIKN